MINSISSEIVTGVQLYIKGYHVWGCCRDTIPWSQFLLCTNYFLTVQVLSKDSSCFLPCSPSPFLVCKSEDCHCHSETRLHLQLCVLQLPQCWPSLVCLYSACTFSSWNTANCYYHCISFISYSEAACSVQGQRTLNHPTDREHNQKNNS